jgi:phosphate transport system permease protein
MKNRVFKILLFCSGLTILLLVGGIFYTLTIQSLPAIKQEGFSSFLSSSEWNPQGKGKYGALPFLGGTLLTSSLALIIAFPFSFSLTLFKSEYYKEGKRIYRWINATIFMCSEIPSIILGLWGYWALRPLLLSLHPENQGMGILVTAIVLALMIIPYSAAFNSFFFDQVPLSIKEGAYCLGATHTEVIRNICFPFAKNGLWAVFALSSGKILGETMIVSMLAGNTRLLPSSITGSGDSIAGIIVDRINMADHLELSALCALALILFCFTSSANYAARYLIKKAVI